MLRRLAPLGLAGLAGLATLAVGCGQGAKKQTGPVVAKGDGISITAQDFKARLEEQSPFMRARFNTLEKKKEFLDNLLRFEVLAKEAERQGYRNDPDVQQTLRKIMVQKLVQKSFNDPASPAAVPDADVQKYYDEHPAEFHRPKRVRAALVAWNAAAGSPDRVKKLAQAKKALAALQAAEKDKKDPGAFSRLVVAESEDAPSKGQAGDLGLKTAEELEKAYSKELATAILALKQGETSGLVETPQGLYLARMNMVQEEVNRTLEQVKPQIVARLSREAKSKEFDEWLKKLKERAKITIDDQALSAVEISAVAGDAPGAMPPHGMRPAQPMPGSEPVPAGPSPAPAAKP